METNNERRLRKLKLLCTTHGMSTVAEKAGLKPVYLEQIIKGVKLPPKEDGSRSERSLGDAAARAIEQAYDLGRGWFDNDGEEEQMMTPKEQELMALFRQLLDPVVQELIVENVREAVQERARSLERMRGTTAREKKGGVKPLDREQLVPAPAPTAKRRARQ